MDFIEKLLGMAPDGGTGLLEWSLVFLAGVVGAAIFRSGAFRHQEGRPRPDDNVGL